jgi:ABC-type glutathione transport system ATPase component
MVTAQKKLVQNAPERCEYWDVLKKLEPILYNLPPKIVTVDGRSGVGKTTLGRFLAWRFNITLIETDLFLIRNKGSFRYRKNDINKLIKSRMQSCRPVIVEGVVVLRLLRDLGRKSDFHIHIVCDEAEGSSITDREWSSYHCEFGPSAAADLVVELPVKQDG